MFAQDTITCSACSKAWDGRTQCPCWKDDAYEAYDSYDSYEAPRTDIICGPDRSIRDYYSLNKEQVRKGLFLQLGTKQGLPKELVISIYVALTKSESDDVDKVREYHTLNIDRDCPGSTGPRIYPIGRGLEWLIKSSTAAATRYAGVNREDNTHKCIEIIGTTGYLNGIIGQSEVILDGVKIVTPMWGEANLQQKMLYLKTSPEDEIIADYEEYLYNHWYGLDNLRLYIDQFGDTLVDI